MKKKKVTLNEVFVVRMYKKDTPGKHRDFPVCIFSKKGLPFVFCATHISGYNFKCEQDPNKAGDIALGDYEVAIILSILRSNSQTSDENVINKVFDDVYDVYDVSVLYKNYEYTIQEFKGFQLIKPDYPIIVGGDFNQNLMRIQYKDTFRRLRRVTPFEEQDCPSIASMFGFLNAYILANEIHATNEYGAAIDGLLVCNINGARLLSRPFDPNSASDHAYVLMELIRSSKNET